MGLDALISRTPTTGTVGGLDASTKTYWRNYFSGAVSKGQPGADDGGHVARVRDQWRGADYIVAGSTAVDMYRTCATLTQNVEGSQTKRLDFGTGTGIKTGLYFQGRRDHLGSDLRSAGHAGSSGRRVAVVKRMYFINTDQLLYEDDGADGLQPSSPHNVRATYVAVDIRAPTQGAPAQRSRPHHRQRFVIVAGLEVLPSSLPLKESHHHEDQAPRPPSTSSACIATSPRPSVRCPEHEIAILREMHGRDNVYQRERTGTDTALDPATEFARLSRKYGRRRCLKAYGAPAIAQREIPRVVEANSTGTVEDEGRQSCWRGGFHRPLLRLAGVRSPAPRRRPRKRAAERSQPETNPF